MIPILTQINIFGFQLYTFGIFLTLSFLAFVFMLNKLSKRFNYDVDFFINWLPAYVISTFFFSRIFFIIGNFETFSYENLGIREFFLNGNYSFSIFGAIFGFFFVYIIQSLKYKVSFFRYFDGIILSILFALMIGYFGGFISGQVYGIPTNLTGFGITYDNPMIPYRIPIFPLGITYSLIFMIIFGLLYSFTLFKKVRGILGTIGLIMIGAVTFGLEFLNGKKDSFAFFYDVNFSQICSLIAIFLGFFAFFKISKRNTVDAQIEQ